MYLLNQVLPLLTLATSVLNPLNEHNALLTNRVILDALIVMGVGFGSVFLVLTLFYFLVLLLRKLFPETHHEG
ncbi:MAG: OadG family protein [Oscillospiraceae bacterium]|nr:OadG family protein [Oscillospiraceae bacterium]MDD4368638.1 OadG family protein [Oscillospiraceae bacterium]